MHVCSKCGKKVFFSINLIDGLCEKCLKEKQEEDHQAFLERKKKADTFLNDLIQLYQKATIDLQKITYEKVNETLNYCIDLEAKFEELPSIPQIGDAIKDRAERQVLYWEIPGLGYIDYDEDKDLFMLGNLFHSVQNRRQVLETMVLHSDEFEKNLCALHHVPIEHEMDIALDMGDRDPWPAIKTYNITARTSLSSLEQFITLDIETTGLNPRENEIIQISAIHFVNFCPINVFSSYVQPQKGLQPSAASINHITNEMLENAPLFTQLLSALSAFIGQDIPIVGHKLSFCYNFLMANGCNIDVFHGRKAYDTFELSKRVFPEQHSFSLDSLCKNELQIARSSTHDAVSDALAIGMLFKHICQERIGF